MINFIKRAYAQNTGQYLQPGKTGEAKDRRTVNAASKKNLNKIADVKKTVHCNYQINNVQSAKLSKLDQ
jgi:hypothetical protein